MKLLLISCALLILVHYSQGIPQYQDCTEESKANIMLTGCLSITCTSKDSHHVLGCAESRCIPGTQIGYKDEDNSKEYPACCGYPICDEK